MKKSIERQLIVIMAALVFVPLFIIIAVSYYRSINTAFTSLDKQNNLQVETVERDYKAIVDENYKTIWSIALNPEVREFVQNPENAGRMTDFMAAVDAQCADNACTIITDGNGNQLARGSGDCVNVSDRAYFQEVMSTGKEVNSDILISKATGERIAIFIVPVFDDGGKVIGAVQRDYKLAHLHDIMAGEVSEEGEDVLISDRNGSVIAHSGHDIPDGEMEDQSDTPWYQDSASKDRGQYVSDFEGTKYLVSWKKDAATGWIAITARNYTMNRRAIIRSSSLLVILGIIFFIIAGFVGYFYSRTLARTISGIEKSASSMADGDFSTSDIAVSSQNELGRLAGSFNTMKQSLQGMLMTAKKNAESVAESAGQFAMVSEQSTQALVSIAGATTDLSSNAMKQRESASDAVRDMDTMQDSMQEVVLNAQKIQEASNITTQKAQEGVTTINKAISNMNMLQEEMNNTQEIMSVLTDQSKDVGEIVDTIKDISGQTNLLALNASIEAARAGEQGKGFAVVATEVGNLAQQSQEASENIRKIVTDIQNSIGEVVNAMQQGIDMTSSSAAVINEAGEMFNVIVANISDLSDKIADSVDASNRAIECSSSVAEILATTEELANTISDNTETISAAVQEQTASMEEIAASSRTMSETASELQGEVNRFHFDEA